MEVMSLEIQERISQDDIVYFGLPSHTVHLDISHLRDITQIIEEMEVLTFCDLRYGDISDHH